MFHRARPGPASVVSAMDLILLLDFPSLVELGCRHFRGVGNDVGAGVARRPLRTDIRAM